MNSLQHMICAQSAQRCATNPQPLRCATRKATSILDEAEWFAHHASRTELEACGAATCHLCSVLAQGPWDFEALLQKPPSMSVFRMRSQSEPRKYSAATSWVGLVCFVTLDGIEIFDYESTEKASQFKISMPPGEFRNWP